MQKINTGAGLREAIILLEIKRAEEEKALREHLHIAYEGMRPINIIKSTYKDVAASEPLKDNLVNASVGLVAGYLTKTLFETVSHSPLRKLIGTALLFGITSTVKNHPEAVKSMAKGLFKAIHGAINARADKGAVPEKETEVILVKETP